MRSYDLVAMVVPVGVHSSGVGLGFADPTFANPTFANPIFFLRS